MTRLGRNMETMHANRQHERREGRGIWGGRGGRKGSTSAEVTAARVRSEINVGIACEPRRNTRAAPAHVTTFKKQWRHAQHERPLFLYLSPSSFTKTSPPVISIFLRDAQITLLLRQLTVSELIMLF